MSRALLGQRARALAALFVCACGASPPPVPEPPEPSVKEAQAAAVALQSSAPPAPLPSPPAERAGQMAELVYVWNNVGPYYQGLFTTQEPMTRLAMGLGPWVEGRANIAVYWNEEDDVGRIRLVLLPGTLPRPLSGEGPLIPLHELAPLTAPLAAYRAELAGRFDLRLASFRVELESVRGAQMCVVGITGAHPADGSLISPCVEINGQQRCGQPEAGGVRFSEEVGASLRRCLSPRG